MCQQSVCRSGERCDEVRGDLRKVVEKTSPRDFEPAKALTRLEEFSRCREPRMALDGDDGGSQELKPGIPFVDPCCRVVRSGRQAPDFAEHCSPLDAHAGSPTQRGTMAAGLIPGLLTLPSVPSIIYLSFWDYTISCSTPAIRLLGLFALGLF